MSDKKLLGEEKQLHYSAIESQISFLQGKVLTIVDASYSDERQLKAVKDLIKSAFHNQRTWILEMCYPEVSMSTREHLESIGVDVEAVERGAVVPE